MDESHETVPCKTKLLYSRLEEWRKLQRQCVAYRLHTPLLFLRLGFISRRQILALSHALLPGNTRTPTSCLASAPCALRKNHQITSPASAISAAHTRPYHGNRITEHVAHPVATMARHLIGAQKQPDEDAFPCTTFPRNRITSASHHDHGDGVLRHSMLGAASPACSCTSSDHLSSPQAVELSAAVLPRPQQHVLLPSCTAKSGAGSRLACERASCPTTCESACS